MALDKILNLGDDQISSQFLVVYPNGIPGGGDAESLSLRMDQSFDPPQRVTGTYDVWHQGQKVVKTNVVEDTDKTFTLPFRLDQGWNIFDTLNAWYTLVYDEEEGTADNDLNTRTVMLVQMLGANKDVVKTLRYEGVKIKSIRITELNNESGDPVRIECEFIYLRVKFE